LLGTVNPGFSSRSAERRCRAARRATESAACGREGAGKTREADQHHRISRPAGVQRKDLQTALKEEITTIEDFGLSPARADDLAFFLEVFYIESMATRKWTSAT